MLELATLGLLQRESLHGYRLKQQLEMFMSGCISVNYGAIYPLLKRLEREGYIKALAEEASEVGPSRTIYAITTQGQERWQQQMLAHPHESWVNSRSRFMIKFFFFSSLEPEQRVKLLNHRLATCQHRLERLETQGIVKTCSDSYHAIAWERHLANLQFEISWLQQQVERHQVYGVSVNLVAKPR
jgi:DNA-binding PadR family transcriptional regulator